jgi:hypothetical protein
MKTIIIVGEHHDFPTGKDFISANMTELKSCGFERTFLEGMLPKMIPDLQRHPADKFNVLDSYKKLYSACMKAGVKLLGSEDTLCRMLIDMGAHPAALKEQREDKFMSDIDKEDTDGVFLTGAGHAADLAKKLKSQGVNVIVILSCPNSPEALARFGQIPDAQLVYKTTDMTIGLSLAAMLTNRIKDISKETRDLMKTKPDMPFPKNREMLLEFYRNIKAFANLDNKEFQSNLDALEYVIGSLYAREKNYEKAIEFTQLSLDRKIKYQADESSIANARNKLELLGKQLEEVRIMEKMQSTLFAQSAQEAKKAVAQSAESLRSGSSQTADKKDKYTGPSS